MKWKIAMITGLALTVGACEKDGTGPEVQESEYTLEVTGALVETATGEAWFGQDTDELGNEVWALLLGEEDSRHMVIVAHPGEDRPAVGTYPIEANDPDGWGLVHLVQDGDELLGMFFAEAGTLTITKSSADVIEGTLAFDASGLMGTALEEIAATASFTAVPAPEVAASLVAGR